MDEQRRKMLRSPGRDSEDDRDKSPKGDKDKKEGLSWRGPGRSLIFWIVAGLTALVIFNLLRGASTDTAAISYSDFLGYLDQNKIASVVFVEKDINGRFTEEMIIAGVTGSDKYKKFSVRIPFEDPKLVEKLTDARVAIKAREEGLNWGGVILSFAPWMLLIFIWLFMMRQMQGGAGGPKGIFSFGKSRAKLVSEEHPKITFADVAGADAVDAGRRLA